LLNINDALSYFILKALPLYNRLNEDDLEEE